MENTQEGFLCGKNTQKEGRGVEKQTKGMGCVEKTHKKRKGGSVEKTHKRVGLFLKKRTKGVVVWNTKKRCFYEKTQKGVVV